MQLPRRPGRPPRRMAVVGGLGLLAGLLGGWVAGLLRSPAAQSAGRPS